MGPPLLLEGLWGPGLPFHGRVGKRPIVDECLVN